RQGGDRQGDGHGLLARDVDPRRRGGAELLGQARGGVLGARRAGAPRARDRGGARHADRRGGTRGGGGRAHEGRMSTLVNTLGFDIETVPDVALGRRLYGAGDRTGGTGGQG